MIRPVNGETVWIEYPEGRHFRAMYDAQSDSFATEDASPIGAAVVANWSRQEHEDYDISDQPNAPKGALARS